MLDIGLVAYEGYKTYTGGKTYDGKDMLSWTDLGPDIRAAWRAAADAVLMVTSSQDK